MSIWISLSANNELLAGDNLAVESGIYFHLLVCFSLTF